jgi:hypothetical protein
MEDILNWNGSQDYLMKLFITATDGSMVMWHGFGRRW